MWTEEERKRYYEQRGIEATSRARRQAKEGTLSQTSTAISTGSFEQRGKALGQRSDLTGRDDRMKRDEWEEGVSVRTTQIYESMPSSTSGWFRDQSDSADGQRVLTGATGAPVFIKKLESRDVFESTPVKLECAVRGNPDPEITWFQDGVIIPEDDGHKQLKYNNGFCSLYIDRVRTDDEAEYVCQASNENGMASTWGELLVEKLIEGMEQLVMEEYHELEVEMEFKWKQPKQQLMDELQQLSEPKEEEEVEEVLENL